MSLAAQLFVRARYGLLHLLMSSHYRLSHSCWQRGGCSCGQCWLNVASDCRNPADPDPLEDLVAYWLWFSFAAAGARGIGPRLEELWGQRRELAGRLKWRVGAAV